MSHRQLVCGRLALAAALALGLGAAAHAQRVVIDAQTGQTRAPSADEVKAMEAQAARGAPPAVGLITGKVNPQPVVQRNGTVTQELDTSTLMYSVARRNADGSISQYCVTGAEAAQALVQTNPSRAPAAPKAGKEQSYELK